MLHNRLFSAPQPPVVLPESGYVRLPLVLAYTGLSKSTWYAGVKDGLYPRQHKIGRRAVGWDVEDIRSWKQGNKAAS